ncbi:hypothetical protein GNF80_04850 [Clostridium perfringens]|nr:hypothetical protein [Clostridium perfringens]
MRSWEEVIVTVIIILASILIYKVKKKQSILISIKKYLGTFIVILLNFIWIPITYIILTKIIHIQNKESVKRILESIDENSWIIIVILLIGFVVEWYLKYRNSRMKYIKHNINNFIIGIAILYINQYILTSKMVNIWFILFIFLVNIKSLFDLDIFFNSNKKNKQSKINKMKEYVCESYDELFPTRKEQASSLINYINSFDSDTRFTLLINGKWGTGKTSLIKAIEDKVKDKYSMIFIQPMLFDQKDLLIKYFCERLKEVLEREKIYTGKGSNLEAYLVSLLNLVNKKANVGLKDITIDNNSKDFREIKKNLQKDIKVCTKNKRIIVIVDDFDRVGTKTKKEILMFIRELIDFDGIDTILLMEYLKILDEENGLTKEYLDKYIDRRIELNNIEFNEIINYFIDIEITCLINELSNNKFDYYKFSVIRNGLVTLKKIIDLIKKNIENSIENLDKKYYENDKIKDENIINNYKEKRTKIIDKINSFYNNIRLIKKVVRETVYCYKKLQFNCTDQLILNEEDIRLIFKLNFIKNLFVEEFDVMIKINDFQKYIEEIYFYAKDNRNYNGVIDHKYIKEFLIEITDISINEVIKINRYKIANAIIKSNFNNINYENKSNDEKIIEKIDTTESYSLIEDILNLNEFSTMDDIISEIKYVYELIFSRFYNGDSYELTKKRINKLNKNIVSFLEDKNNKLEVLLQIFYSITRVYERYLLTYWIVKDIYKASKEDNYINYNNRILLENYIKNIRINILNHITKIINILLSCLNKGIIDDQLFHSTDKLNEVVESKFSSVLEIKSMNLEEEEKLRCNLFFILNFLIKNNYLEKVEFKSLKISVTNLLIVERILSKVNDNVGKSKKIKNSHEARLVIDGCKTYLEFEMVANTYLNDILSKDILNSNDLNVMWGIKVKIQEFINKENVDEIIEKLKIILMKLEKNKHPNDYNYIEVIKLRIGIDNLKKK